MKQPNRIKAAMRAGRKAYGYNLSFPSPWVIDILGKLDFDFVFIDGEHGPFGLDQLEDLCRTAERYNLTPIARVPDIGPSTILRYLDRGIRGVLGPHIATEADTRQLVRACYFGPLGERSFGANRGTDYNAGIPDKAAYYREANEQTLVCALLEDAAVLDTLDTILAVPGIVSIRAIKRSRWSLSDFGIRAPKSLKLQRDLLMARIETMPGTARMVSRVSSTAASSSSAHTSVCSFASR